MSNCGVGSGGFGLPGDVVAQHGVEGCDHPEIRASLFDFSSPKISKRPAVFFQQKNRPVEWISIVRLNRLSLPRRCEAMRSRAGGMAITGTVPVLELIKSLR